jgi:superfamily II DNA or RNA helicase
MNIFSVHADVIKDYKSYITGFINIQDESIRKTVENELEAGKLWPDPLLQFNPAFRAGDSVETLCNEGILHPAVANIFHGYSLYEHQADAIRKGRQGEGFIVTSGTGSGKSLTYLATIFNDLLLHPPAKPGVRAVIVYPMNALINSQFEEIQKYEKQYVERTQQPFPVTYGQYTGQEKDGEKASIRENPPSILLTNYMMLELVLTRTQERTMRATLFEHLQFLVFDELHTYRGRQGADVSLLIRRLRTQSRHSVTCIGTSATMVTGGTLAEQREQVATVASTIFGTTFTTKDVINETLDYSLGVAGTPPSPDVLRSVIEQPLDQSGDENALKQHPLAAWLENEVALQIKEKTLVRGAPMTLPAIADLLHESSGASMENCKARLQELLDWLNYLNAARKGQRGTLLPFKLHQFISQTGAVYVSLAAGPDRIITLDPGVWRVSPISGQEQRIYPVAFSRASGHAFICVARQGESKGAFHQREFRRPGENGQESGYLILGDNVWDAETDAEELPDSWVNRLKDGSISLKQPFAAEKRPFMPEKIWFNNDGTFSVVPDDAHPYSGWWMRAPLLFDPTSGLFYDQRTNEGTKLTTLGSEGRSTSTTVLSSTILKQLAGAGVEEKEEKLLSFTDNRQDAALQAGHFNDFVQVANLRAGILRALDHAKEHALDFAQLPQAVFEALALPITAYSASDNPSQFAAAQRDTRNALKDYLVYCALYDLRRGWRVIMPNLEQCGLLVVDYANLSEICNDRDDLGNLQWAGVPLLAELSFDRRIEVVRQLLDYFRTSYALHNDEYLTPEKMRQRFITINDELRDPYRLQKGEIPEPYVLTYRPLAKSTSLFTASVGAQSNVGRYLRRIIAEENAQRKKASLQLLQADASRAHYEGLIIGILGAFEGARWLTKTSAKDRDQNSVAVYRLNASKLIWRRGDGKTIRTDRVRNRAYKDSTSISKPSSFFQDLYRTSVTEGRKRIGREHTGQLSTQDRQEREDGFREGHINALFCSPTMELGIDIASLNVVHMRNVPPNPANYAQRSGRAGRSGQAALVVTYCSNYAPHDRHYFAKATEMVAGQVAAPRLDLGQRELLISHLNALFLAELGTDEFNASLADIIDTDNLGELPLRASVRAALIPTADTRKRIREIFEQVLATLPEKDCQNYNGSWIEEQLDRVVNRLDAALDRWRNLYKLADKQLLDAQTVMSNPIYKDKSPELRQADRLERQAIKQRHLLRNEVKGSHLSGSEFYPFRYLAAEGFLPGYNFTRLPIRTFLPKGSLDGEFISRSRSVALREFGPRNIVYHNGAKYRIEQLQVASIEQSLRSAKVSSGAGYFMQGDDYHRSVCPFSGVPLDGDAKEDFKDVLVEMTETRAEEIERISCEEEERRSEGFLIDTYFTLPGGLDTRQLATVRSGESDLLNVSYLPAAQLVHVNRKWRSAKEIGFLVGMTYGKWQREAEQKPKKGMPVVDPATKEPTHRIQLYTTITSDALYIEPIAALALDQAGVITLQYALKRAIEQVFQLEPNEIGVTLMGRHEKKPANIFLFENAEGSLGVLKQFVQDKDIFHRVVTMAAKLCRFDEIEYHEKASYSDLLSYYNQRDHDYINRFLIKEGLDKLSYAQVELQLNPQFTDYEHHYKHLLNTYDTSSSTERRFLEYLYLNDYRLPDVAQLRVDDLYCQPDFCYNDAEMRTWIFCDGTPHDEPTQKVRDQKLRAAIKSRGDSVITYHYLDPLEDLVAARPDLFRKVR